VIRRLFGLIGPAPDPSDPAARAVRASSPAAPIVVAPGPPADLAWRELLKRRALVIVAFLSVWVVAIEARLFHLQIIQHADLAQRAARQQNDVIKSPAIRGDIVDRNGVPFAFSVQGYSVTADPSVIDNPSKTVGELCAVIHCAADERRELLKRLSDKDSRYAPVRHVTQISPAQTDRLRAKPIQGILLIEETRRYYPQSELGAQLVGFVGRDNAGLSGIESIYDSTIRGTGGVVLVLHDARRRSVSTRVQQEPTRGATVELTINLRYQHILERELAAGIREHRAVGGTAIMMDPRTGEILALASYPSFNPNTFGRSEPSTYKIPAFQDAYEPGSTYKIVTLTAGLESGVLTPNSLLDCSPGFIKLPGRKPITDDHKYGVLTFAEAIVKSSNVCAIRAGWKVGAELMSRWARRYGFGQTHVPKFPGESGGIVTPVDRLNDSELASMSMGYAISVTPIQMVLAMSSIANGGNLMEPHLVRAIIRNGVREEIAPRVVRQTASASTIAWMTPILEEVVNSGTAKAAKLDRYQVAGKTGTAKKAIPGGYSDTDRNSSFVGFVPSRRPEFAILVVIDTPRAGQVYGGAVAAPIFKRIAEAALVDAGVPPTINPAPPILHTATELPAEPVERKVTLVPAGTASAERGVVPDVRGLGAREATKVMMGAGLYVRMKGEGVVVAQSPEPGAPLESGSMSVLELRRAPAGGGSR
jgi:cell division protein FtsI (penicillin-binding protein 3)